MAAGSGTDVAMRIVAEQLGKMWGQQTLLVNQPGAGGAIAARAAATAAPDGHTLFMAIASTFTSLPETAAQSAVQRERLRPDRLRRRSADGDRGRRRRFPVNSLPELIALSKKQPGGLNVAVGFRGGIPHLTAELFRSRSGADLTPVTIRAARRP